MREQGQGRRRTFKSIISRSFVWRSFCNGSNSSASDIAGSTSEISASALVFVSTGVEYGLDGAVLRGSGELIVRRGEKGDDE